MSRTPILKPDPSAFKLIIKRSVTLLGINNAALQHLADFMAKALHKHFETIHVWILRICSILRDVQVFPESASNHLKVEVAHQRIQPIHEAGSDLLILENFKSVLCTDNIRRVENDVIPVKEFQLQRPESGCDDRACVRAVKHHSSEYKHRITWVNLVE